jgi:Zn-dependent peptidase ImmA (M78 family)/transcriptional regulator with XRE-family HTH domain
MMTMTIRSSHGTDATEADFSPERLTLAREKRKLTKQQLADLCEVSRRTVTAWERGDISNPPIALLSEKLNFPEGYFSAGDPAIIDSESVSFRALSNSTARQVHSAMAAASMAVEFVEWIEAYYRLPAVNLPDTEQVEQNPVIAAESVRRSWKLSPGPISNMFSALEKRGVRVFSLPGGDRAIDAFSFWRDGSPYVFLNPDRTPERQRFDLAHELGHLVLHKGKQLARSRVVEQEANDFASAFLMPADALYLQVVGELRYADVFRLKAHWRVSAMAVVERLRRLQLITEWIHRKWIIDLAQEGYRSDEPVGIDPERSKLLTEILERAREDGWTILTIARHLQISPVDLNSLLFSLGRVAVEGSGQTAPRIAGHLRRVK